MVNNRSGSSCGSGVTFNRNRLEENINLVLEVPRRQVCVCVCVCVCVRACVSRSISKQNKRR